MDSPDYYGEFRLFWIYSFLTQVSCWGVDSLVSQENTPFKSAAAAHPAMVDANDAPKMTIPILLLPSNGEDKNDVAAYEKKLKVKHEVEWYDDQVHGWLAAR